VDFVAAVFRPPTFELAFEFVAPVPRWLFALEVVAVFRPPASAVAFELVLAAFRRAQLPLPLKAPR
jgi:hypothetical protein